MKNTIYNRDLKDFHLQVEDSVFNKRADIVFSVIGVSLIISHIIYLLIKY